MDRAARRGYQWNALTNNCSHVIHNALAAAGVWDPKTVRAGTTVDTILDLLSVATAVDAIELMLAGACAVQVGTATFADPRAPLAVLDGLEDWCRLHEIDAVTDLIGGVHG